MSIALYMAPFLRRIPETILHVRFYFIFSPLFKQNVKKKVSFLFVHAVASCYHVLQRIACELQGEMMDVVCVCERFRCIHRSSVCFRRSFLIQLPQFFVFLFFFFFLLNCILNSTDAASNAARKQKNSWSLLKLVISFFLFSSPAGIFLVTYL